MDRQKKEPLYGRSKLLGIKLGKYYIVFLNLFHAPPQKEMLVNHIAPKVYKHIMFRLKRIKKYLQL